MNRRDLLITFSRLAPLALLPLALPACAKTKTPTPEPKGAAPLLNKSKSEWKALLPDASYRVLFEEDTERPGSSPLNHEKRTGTYVCAACKLPLFSSAQKFDSGTGWPSFSQPMAGALGKKQDLLLVLPRTEYHCGRCGGHQGHVFDDGPAPSGLRYCNNGVALNFVLDGEPLPALVA